ncbi:MAG: hypothetical protein IJ856_01635 [Candidatus Methanomethylophilaceae archaeon]|nr:hypothetical protein [Candidatus Methanomethylophilaceae archaeon]
MVNTIKSTWNKRNDDICRVLSYVKDENIGGRLVKKEDAYSLIRASRQTQVKILSELLDDDYLECKKTGPHNAKYLTVTNRGLTFIDLLKGSDRADYNHYAGLMEQDENGRMVSSYNCPPNNQRSETEDYDIGYMEPGLSETNVDTNQSDDGESSGNLTVSRIKSGDRDKHLAAIMSGVDFSISLVDKESFNENDRNGLLHTLNYIKAELNEYRSLSNRQERPNKVIH